MEGDRERISERERQQMEQIRELDFEELLVEEVESLYDDSGDDDRRRAIGQFNDNAAEPGQFTFNTSLASLHSYLGEVEYTHHRLAFLDGGRIHQLPLLYFEGVVLFPEATLPLRVVHPTFLVAIERALSQIDQGTPLIIGVVRLYRDPNGKHRLTTTGTTAEIRQYRRLEDGSINAVTRGQQRFRMKRCWNDADGVICGDVQIIDEDLPQRTPRDVFNKLGPINNTTTSTYTKDDDSEAHSEHSFVSALLPHDTMDVSTSSDENKLDNDSEQGRSNTITTLHKRHQSSLHKSSGVNISRAFWPHWVYRMYDSYVLAQKAADMWKQIVGAPAMDSFVEKPGLLSFHIASKIPVSESTRQELLEIDGIPYRLRREIELLECCDRIRCKTCQGLIAKRRSNMLVMSSEGPLGAYVNDHGHVHEIVTLHKVNGLVLMGRSDRRYSWFPGYAWTIANCGGCGAHMGWLYTATNGNLRPRSFWGIRSSEVADETESRPQ